MNTLWNNYCGILTIITVKHKHMKRILILLLLLSFSGIAAAQYDPKALSILDEMSSYYKSISSFKAQFSYILENTMENINEEFSGEITVKGDQFKLDLGEQIIFNDGETQWTYLKDVNEVNIDYYLPEDGDMSPSNIFSAYKKGYKYMYIEEQVLGGVANHVIDLVPDDQGKAFFKIKLWITKSNNRMSQWKLFDKTGNTYLYNIKKFESNVKVSESDFVFDPAKYPDVTEIDLR